MFANSAVINVQHSNLLGLITAVFVEGVFWGWWVLFKYCLEKEREKEYVL